MFEDSIIKDDLGTQRTQPNQNDITAAVSKDHDGVSQTLTSAVVGDMQTQFKSIIPDD